MAAAKRLGFFCVFDDVGINLIQNLKHHKRFFVDLQKLETVFADLVFDVFVIAVHVRLLLLLLSYHIKTAMKGA